MQKARPNSIQTPKIMEQNTAAKQVAKVTDLNIVVVGDNNYASLLNPDYLIRKSLVSGDRLVNPDESFTTPVASRVAYQDGLTVASLPKNLIVQEHLPDDKVEAAGFTSPSIAVGILQDAPKMQCRAVGINPRALTTGTDSALPLKLFLDGPWLGSDFPNKACKATFISERKGVQCTIDIELKRKDEKSSIYDIVYHGNYHRKIESEADTYKETIDFINGEWKNALSDFRSVIANWSQAMGIG